VLQRHRRGVRGREARSLGDLGEHLGGIPAARARGVRAERRREEAVNSAHNAAMVDCRLTTSKLLFPSCSA
jgi:hypothetical protein